MNDYKRSIIAHNISANYDVEYFAAYAIATCMCKRTFKSREAADEYGSKWGQRTYKCDVCGLWHLSGESE